MDIELIFEIQRRREDWGIYLNKKLRVPIKECPQCTKNYVPTPRSPDICIFCYVLNRNLHKAVLE